MDPAHSTATRRLRRAALTLGVLATAWIAAEQLLAPRLASSLGLEDFLLVRDVDHRPRRAGEPGWNADSLRCAFEAEDFLPEDLSVLFLGDSFTLGYEVEAGEAFPSLVQEKLRRALPERNVKVANFAWVSSSPLLSLRRLEEIGERYAPDHVALCVDMTDIHDEIRWRRMLERSGIYAWYGRTPIALALLRGLAPSLFERWFFASNPALPRRRYFACEAPLEETRASFEPLRESLGRLAAWCRERDVGFSVYVLPRAFQYSARESPRSWEAGAYEPLGPFVHEPFRWFEEYAAEAAHPVHSLLEAFRATDVFPTCFDNDPHWNPAGHRVAAEALAPLLLADL